VRNYLKLAENSLSDVRIKEPEIRRAFEVLTQTEGGIDWGNMDISIETHDIISIIEGVKNNEMKRKMNDMESQKRRRNF